MEIVTKRFLLRDFVQEDEPAFLTYHADPRYAEFCSPEEVTPDFTHQLFQRFMQWATAVPRCNYQLAIVDRRTLQLIGCGGLRQDSYAAEQTELGIELAPQYWGRYAYAIEIGKALIDFGFRVSVLPDEKYGVALLYNISAMPLIAFALPQIKSGLIQLLTDGTFPKDGFSIHSWGISLAVLTVIGVAFAVRSLLHLPQWKEKIHATPTWHMILSIAWMFFPSVVVLAMPWLVRMTSDRIFNYQQLFRAMPDVMLWLSLCAGFGFINGTIRLIACANNGRS